jgi:hypothetical protein
VRVLVVEFKVFPCRFCICAFPDFTFFHTLSAGDRSWRTEPGEVRPPRSAELRAQLVPGPVRRP